MKVALLNHTKDALELLLFTRSTRLNMSPSGLAEIQLWSDEHKMAELEKARNTIQSSWEFIDYTFSIEEVTRAFTHQLVRHRVGTSFAQQSQRAVDMTDFSYEEAPSIEHNPVSDEIYRNTMLAIAHGYHKLLDAGADKQDARGVLPTNIHTNIVFKANLSTLHQMALKRLCVRTQGEFQEVFRAIKTEVVKVHPWAEKFLRVQCAWNSTCIFPDFPADACPVKMFVHDPRTGRAYARPGYPSTHAIPPDEVQALFDGVRYSVQP